MLRVGWGGLGFDDSLPCSRSSVAIDKICESAQETRFPGFYYSDVKSGNGGSPLYIRSAVLVAGWFSVDWMKHLLAPESTFFSLSVTAQNQVGEWLLQTLIERLLSARYIPIKAFSL